MYFLYFLGSRANSENCVPALAGASFSRFQGTLKQHIFHYFLEFGKRALPGTTFGGLFEIWVDF